MKFDFNWLVELTGYKKSAKELAELLSSHSLESEIESEIEFKNIIVAKVTKISSHPNADRLRLITLTDGKKTYNPVVCGAWNFEVGVKVALALPGAVIPHDQHNPDESFVLEKAVIRGVESQGMICSSVELGLGKNADGIMVLETTTPIGSNLSKIFKPNSNVLEITSFANRPDTISYLGIANEIASLTGTKVKFNHPKFDLRKYKPKLLKVKVAEKKACPRYIAARFTDVNIKESPKFIQDRLLASGLRPVNNVVDITNYAMLLVGQPLHAFDASKLIGGIQIRHAYVNEKIKTLDKVERVLKPDMLMIADATKPIGIAGVMGSDDSSVDEFTNEIILEAANFKAKSIRQTSLNLGLRTDASLRFEKSLPLFFSSFALAYATELLMKYAQAKPQEVKLVGDKDPKQTIIKLDPTKVNSLLGVVIKPIEQKKILSKFGYIVRGLNKLTVTVPAFRPDATLWQDLAEDIGRYHGIDEILPVQPISFTSASMTEKQVDQTDQAIDTLVGLGFTQMHNYPFVSASDLAKWGVETKNAVEITRPLSNDQQYLTLNLLFSLLTASERNSRFFKQGNCFEINKVFWEENGRIIETKYLAMLSYANKTPVAKLLGSFQELCQRLNVNIQINQDEPTKADIQLDGKTIGKVGTHPVSKLNWIGLYIDFEKFLQAMKKKEYQTVSKYPSVELDISLLAKKDLLWSKIENVITSVNTDLVKSVRLFDVFEGKDIPMGKKNMSFRIVYQARDRTLKDQEVKAVHDQIVDKLQSKLGVQIRN
jgi:phenylalanyl-tRNA synthetase beta chain